MPRWIKEEETILKRLWDIPEVSLEEMTKVLKTRSVDAIKMKAKSLGLPLISARQTPELDLEYYRKLMEVVEG